MPLTPDAIPTNEQLRESLSDRFYHPHKKLLLTSATVFLALVIAYLGLREYQKSRLDDMWSRYHEAVVQFDPGPLSEPDANAAQKQLEMLAALVKDYPEDAVTPFALQQRARTQIAVGEYEGAQSALDEIRARFK